MIDTLDIAKLEELEKRAQQNQNDAGKGTALPGMAWLSRAWPGWARYGEARLTYRRQPNGCRSTS